MKEKMASAIMLTLLLTGMLALAFNIKPAKASGTIYIRADGSVDPPTAPISTADNVTYTFTGDIYDAIVVERDNIAVDGAGYTATGSGSGNGTTLTGRSNVTVRNMTTRNFAYGISLSYGCSNNTVSGNNAANNGDGIRLYSSNNNTLSGNNFTANNGNGIVLNDHSYHNTLSGNNIANNGDGIWLYLSSDNTLSGNNVTASNYYGIWLDHYSYNNVFHHNNFINNTQQVYIGLGSSWDDGYLSGGNYWSDYNGIDLYRGPHQNEIGSDGIGDTPYVIGKYDQDDYPLMKPYPWDPHDVGTTSVRTSRNIVGQGFNVSINASVFNYGDSTEDFNVTIYANSTAICEIDNIELASRNSTTINFTWDTAGFAMGNYTMTVYVTPVSGETDTTDNNSTVGWVLVTILGDVDGDFEDGHYDVDLFDAVKLLAYYGAKIGDSNYDPNCDIDNDGQVFLFDAVMLLGQYGQKYP